MKGFLVIRISNLSTYIHERVAVGRKYPCRNRLDTKIVCKILVRLTIYSKLLHSRPTDVHKVERQKGPKYSTVSPTYYNFSPVAHEISSGEAPKRGKFTEGSCMDKLDKIFYFIMAGSLNWVNYY